MKMGFYLLGQRAYEVFRAFISREGRSVVAWVVVGRDSGIANDFHDEIIDLCSEARVDCYERTELPRNLDVPDLQFCVGWKWLIPEYDNLVVFHDSLLPRYRGFAPVVNALINGDRWLGVTALLGGAEYDTGLILGQKKIELIYPVTVRDAILATAPLYQHLMFEILDKYRSMGILRGQAQDERLATYSLWRDESDYRIDWRQSSQKIKRLIDAVGLPYAGASTTWRTKILRILEAEVVPDVVVEARGSHIGKVIFNQLEGFVVVCGTGLLKIKKAVDDDTGEAINLPFRSRFE